MEAVAATTAPVDVVTTGNEGHGRDETRTVAVFDASKAVAGTEWQDLVSSIIRVTRIVHTSVPKTGFYKTTSEVAYYLSVKPASASAFSYGIRGHWGIENCNHYPRDTAFGEDASRIRTNPGIFARLRSFAYNILSINKTKSFPQARLRAAFRGVPGLLKFTVA